MTQRIDIPVATILKIALVILGLWFLYFIRDVIVLLFIVTILVSALSPTVDKWAKYISRPGAVISVFLLIFLVIGLSISLIIPPFVSQLREFSFNLPFYVENLSRSNDQGILGEIVNSLRTNLSHFSTQLSNLGSVILQQTYGIVSGVVAVVTLLVLTFYLLLEEDGLKRIFKGVTPKEWYETLLEPTRKISTKLGSWVRAHLLAMLLVGVMTTVGLLIIGMPYALILGIWAGLTEAIPIIGPWIATVTGVIVGASISPVQGLLALIVYIIVQQVESNILIPRVMSKAVGINPVMVILAILVGGKVYGILGILLAVPIAAVISVVAEDWQTIRHLLKKSD